MGTRSHLVCPYGILCPHEAPLKVLYAWGTIVHPVTTLAARVSWRRQKTRGGDTGHKI